MHRLGIVLLVKASQPIYVIIIIIINRDMVLFNTLPVSAFLLID